MRARGNRPLFLIDIAVPRDIDPEANQLDNVYLYNIDDLETLVRENVKHREQDLALCRDIINQKSEAFMTKLVNGAKTLSAIEGGNPHPALSLRSREREYPLLTGGEDQGEGAQGVHATVSKIEKTESEETYDTTLQPQSGWIFCGAIAGRG
jgi:hypothetical protein